MSLAGRHTGAGPALPVAGIASGLGDAWLMDTPLTDEGDTSRTRLRSFSPIFPVRDMRRALAHYRSLGFGVTPYADGGFYGFADRDGVSLHLSLDTGHDHDGEHAPDHEHAATAARRPACGLRQAVRPPRATQCR
jgi:hypothetical protein